MEDLKKKIRLKIDAIDFEDNLTEEEKEQEVQSVLALFKTEMENIIGTDEVTIETATSPTAALHDQHDDRFIRDYLRQEQREKIKKL